MSMYGKKANLVKERQEQEELKEKYGIEDEAKEVEVKVTNNTAHFVLHSFGVAFRVIATIGIAVLAAIGIVALAYPEIRAEVLRVIFEALHIAFPGGGDV